MQPRVSYMNWNIVTCWRHCLIEVYIKLTFLSLNLFLIASHLILRLSSQVILLEEVSLPCYRYVFNLSIRIIVMHMIHQVKLFHHDYVNSQFLMLHRLLQEMIVFLVFLEMHLCVFRIILLLLCVVVIVPRPN